MFEFVEEPDMSIVSPASINPEIINSSNKNNTNNKDRLHTKKRPAQMMS